MKKLVILGSTGSIGVNALNIIRTQREELEVLALSAGANFELLAAQAKEFRPQYIALRDESKLGELKVILADMPIQILAGDRGVQELAALNSDLTLVAISCAQALMPAYIACCNAKSVAFANKESLVCGGPIILEAARKHNCKVWPVDSEHSAIYQVLAQKENIEKIILTASGGPFRGYTYDQLKNVKAAQALKHPNWDMGAKVTIDSATLMNKGLELIEACYLFDLPQEQIEILVHPESIIHGMVAYKDGSYLAQMGCPDMKAPISYALNFGKRTYQNPEKLDFKKLASLHFEDLDEEVFKGPSLARQALMIGSQMPIIMNAANEIGVSEFLKDKIGFLDIVNLTQEVMSRVQVSAPNSIEDVLEIDATARQMATKFVQNFVTV